MISFKIGLQKYVAYLKKLGFRAKNYPLERILRHHALRDSIF